MKIIKLGNSYDIYDDNLIVLDKIPAKVFVVRFAKMKGFFLQESDLANISEKIYGVHTHKTAKVLNTFHNFERNLGVILSGDKGIGKSLFAKLLAQSAIKENIPVIIVDQYIPGIASYLEEIKQEVMVMFDEFDKTFANNNLDKGESDPQASLLSLFDGFAAGKKLFVITCNEIRRLNDYLINRPGRFHYHFRFEYPTAEEIKNYLMDKMTYDYSSEISKVISFSKKINLNYDCLRSIAYELNQGISFDEAISDLNIINTNSNYYNLTLYFNNGMSISCYKVPLDLFSDAEDVVRFNYPDNEDIDILARFNPRNSVFDQISGMQIVPADKFKLEYDFDYLNLDNAKDKNMAEKVKAMIPSYILIEKQLQKNIHYIV